MFCIKFIFLQKVLLLSIEVVPLQLHIRCCMCACARTCAFVLTQKESSSFFYVIITEFIAQLFLYTLIILLHSQAI